MGRELRNPFGDIEKKYIEKEKVFL